MRRFVLIVLLFTFLTVPAEAQSIVTPAAGEDATEANSQPKLARTAGGTIYLVYAAPSGGFSQIFLARSTDGGIRWDRIPVTAARVDSKYAALAVDEGGAAHVAWTQYDRGTGRVYYARYASGRWTPPVRVSVGAEYAGIPSIAVGPGGRVHLVWYGIRSQAPAVRTRHGSIYEILYSRTEGARWSVPVIISPGIPDSINPTLAADAAGRLHSAWYQFDARAYQTRYTQYDGRWQQPVTVSTGGGDAAAVAMTVEPGGKVHLAWEQRSAAGVQILYAEKESRWSGQQPVSPAGQRACCPTVAVDAQRRVYVVWESDGRLYLRRREGEWSGVDRLTPQPGNHQPVLGSSGTHVDLAWTQEAGQRTQIRFATIAGGAPGAVGRSPSPSLRATLILVAIVLLILWQLRRMRRVQHTTGSGDQGTRGSR